MLSRAMLHALDQLPAIMLIAYPVIMGFLMGRLLGRALGPPSA